MDRKSPYKHTVSSHTRTLNGKRVKVRSYTRGSGKPPSFKGTRRVRSYTRGTGKTKNKIVGKRQGITGRKSYTYYRRGPRKNARVGHRMRSQWKSDHSGDTDFSFDAKEKKEFIEYKHGFGKPVELPYSDIKSLDEPRGDMTFIYGPTDRKIYISGSNKANRKKFKKILEDVSYNNFTRKEVLEMGPLHVDLPKKGRFAGSHFAEAIQHKTHITGEIRNPSSVEIRTDYFNDKHVLTHELIHARRQGMGDRVKDRTKDEKETELEAFCRDDLESAKMTTAGYYQYIPEVRKLYKENWNKGKELQKRYELEDRKLILGKNSKNYKTGAKGKYIINRVKEMYPKTHISRAHFSPAEKLDRYFHLSIKNAPDIRVHRRYIPGDIPTQKEIIKGFRERFGPITIYEYRDGKKVKIS